jgi:hypothetical protein
MTDWDINTIIPRSTLKRNNGEYLPNGDYIRCLIVGPSGCGKTTLLTNFLLSPGWVDKENTHVYIYSKSLNQPEYVFLQILFNEVEAEINEKICMFCDNNDDAVRLDNCNSNSIVIFDDFIQENQDNVRDYYTRGRHKQIDVFYLGQTYSKIPKQLVRDNVNFLCIFRQDNLNLKHINDEFVGGDFSFDEFSSICSDCWNQDYGFITTDLTRKRDDGKYRNKIKYFIVFEED